MSPSGSEKEFGNTSLYGIHDFAKHRLAPHVVAVRRARAVVIATAGAQVHPVPHRREALRPHQCCMCAGPVHTRNMSSRGTSNVRDVTNPRFPASVTAVVSLSVMPLLLGREPLHHDWLTCARYCAKCPRACLPPPMASYPLTTWSRSAAHGDRMAAKIEQALQTCRLIDVRTRRLPLEPPVACVLARKPADCQQFGATLLRAAELECLWDGVFMENRDLAGTCVFSCSCHLQSWLRLTPNSKARCAAGF